ncbi:MAG: response regulator transcription factor [Acidimicrobiia bacterium]|nr:MAG: response regulator transcription factor [Acidimicrobiia bacterium]
MTSPTAYVAVFPESSSPSLTGALLSAGFRPVPVSGVSDAGAKEPEVGWAAVVVEIGRDPDVALAVASKIREELAAAVLIVLDRTLSGDLIDRDGFDDFILTPIDATELRIRLARIGSGLGSVPDADIIRYEDLELNTGTYQATIAGQPKDLTYMEYELLRFLVENPNRVWSREQLLSRVWGYDYFGGSRTVDVHIRRLRAKLGEQRASWITTVRSVGYRFG